MKKLALVLVLVLAFALPVFANPFVDVPLNHWAYDSVQSLAAKGIIVGFPDGTFGGAKSLTRYEFAEATAKALAYVEGMDFASADDVAILEKLAIEFADELASLGVTVADLEASLGANSEAIAALETTVAKLDTFFEPLTITGRFRATYEDNYYGNAAYTGATLKDQTKLYLVATINDKTTAGVTLTSANNLGAVATSVTGNDFFIDFADGEYFAKLKYGDIASGDVGKIGVMGLVFKSTYDGKVDEDAGTRWNTDEFEGLWASWSMLNATWTGISEVDYFYTVKGQWDNFGVYASFDKTSPTKPAGSLADYVVGADVDYTFDDEVTNLKLDAAYQVLSGGYGAAAKLTTKLGDEDEIGVTIDGQYILAAFDPTARNYTPDNMGGSAKVTYLFDVEDLEKTEAFLKYTYRTKISDPTVIKYNKVDGGIDFTIDEANSETAALGGGYRLGGAVPGTYYAYAEYLNYPLADDFKLSGYFEYDAAGQDWVVVAPAYFGTLTLDYAYSDTTTFQLAGRYDSEVAAGVPNYSVYAEVKHTLAENTTLKVYYELNEWDDDWDYAPTFGIQNGIGTLWSRLEVTF